MSEDTITLPRARLVRVMQALAYATVDALDEAEARAWVDQLRASAT